MRKLYLDFETRSTVDIKKSGAWAYAQHPDTEILCLAFAVDDGPVIVLTKEQLRHKTYISLAGADVLLAHNAGFEYAIWRFIMHERLGYPAQDAPSRWGCTLSRAAMCNLPLSLDKLGRALTIDAKKDMGGRNAMMRLCKAISYDETTKRPIYNEDLILLHTLYKYCAQDVEAEREIDKRLPDLPPRERAIWELDLIINRRGIQTDTELARNASALALQLTDELNVRLDVRTKGAVSKASRVGEMKRWLSSRGVETPDGLDKEAVNHLLAAPSTPHDVKEVLSIRRQVGKSSTAKYAAIINAASPADGRVRGTLQYHAASTGRWGGRLMQLQNLPKGLNEKEQTAAVALINEKDPHMFSLVHGDQAMQTLSDTLRGTIIAAPGKTLMVADFAQIEARVVLWLAGDTRGLEMFASGKNLYLDMAEFIYQKNGLTKKDALEYAVGKMTILGAGFGMGKDRFKAQCATFGIDISIDMAAQAIRAYRDKYSSVKHMWYAVEKAARSAVKFPGKVFPSCGGKVHWGMSKNGEFLCARLPSGRHLRYFKPFMKPNEYGEEIHFFCAGLNGALEENKTYGGSLTENVVQAVARDLMAGAMLRVEATDFPVVLTVHDEIVAEVAEEKTSALKDFIAIMCEVPTWATGLPIAAEGWVGKRYRK